MMTITTTTITKREEVIFTFEENDSKIQRLEIVFPTIFEASLYVTNE